MPEENVIDIKPEPIPDGVETKHRIIIKDPQTSREASYIKRKILSDYLPEMYGFSEEEIGKTLAEKYVAALTIMRDRGMPVPETAIIISEDEVAVTDVISGGGKVCDPKEELRKIREGLPRDEEMDKQLSAIPLPDLVSQANNFGETATHGGILIAPDCYHLIIKGDGSWSLMTLDIADTRIWKDPEQAKSETLHAKFGNNEMIRKWIKMVKLLRDAVTTVQPVSVGSTTT